VPVRPRALGSEVVPLSNAATMPTESDAARAAAFLRTTDPAASYTGAPLPQNPTERTAVRR
jgi:hypothetical protein